MIEILDPSKTAWFLLALELAPWIALVFSLLSVIISWRAFQLAKAQEDRRKPNLALVFHRGFIKFVDEPDGRIYGFFTTITNRSDNDNSVSQIELFIVHQLKGTRPVSLKIGEDKSLKTHFAEGIGNLLYPPVRLDAHQSATGWILFFAPSKILASSTIEKYLVVFTDSHGTATTFETIILPEYQDVATNNTSVD